MNKISGLIIVIAAAAIAAFGQQPQFKRIFDYYVAEQNFSGAAIVAANGKIEYLNGAGFANRQNQTVLTSKSKFRICSITKTFTAVLITRLVELGRMNVQAPGRKYLPEYTGAAKTESRLTICSLIVRDSTTPTSATKRFIQLRCHPPL